MRLGFTVCQKDYPSRRGAEATNRERLLRTQNRHGGKMAAGGPSRLRGAKLPKNRRCRCLDLERAENRTYRKSATCGNVRSEGAVSSRFESHSPTTSIFQQFCAAQPPLSPAIGDRVRPRWPPVRNDSCGTPPTRSGRGAQTRLSPTRKARSPIWRARPRPQRPRPHRRPPQGGREAQEA